MDSLKTDHTLGTGFSSTFFSKDVDNRHCTTAVNDNPAKGIVLSTYTVSDESRKFNRMNFMATVMVERDARFR